MKMTKVDLESIKKTLKGDYYLWWSEDTQSVMAVVDTSCNRDDIPEDLICSNGCKGCAWSHTTLIFFEVAIFAALREYLSNLSRRQKILFIDFIMKEVD